MNQDMKYTTIIDIVKERFPEIQEHEECKFIDDETPYLFFPAFWKLLELCLTGVINDNCLRDRILDFMEEMAVCDDSKVVELMAVEMLEPLFGLKYETYPEVTFRLLRPQTLQLHKKQLPFFNVPQPH